MLDEFRITQVRVVPNVVFLVVQIFPTIFPWSYGANTLSVALFTSSQFASSVS